MARFSFQTRPWLVSFALGLLHALLFTLAFPPFNLGFLAFVALIPLMIVAQRTPRPARSAVAVALGSLPMWLFVQRWLIDVTAAGYPALALLLSVYPGLFVWCGARLRRVAFFERHPGLHLAALPILWTGIEFFRGSVFMHGYPWYLLAHPTIDVPFWAQNASLVGAYGVSLFTSGANAMILGTTEWARSRPRRWLIGGVVLVMTGGVVVGVCGAVAKMMRLGVEVEMTSDVPPPLRVAVIQTNIPQDNKNYWSVEQRVADFARFIELTRQAAAATPKPDLIVWPETMFPGLSLNDAAVEVERAAGLVESSGEIRVHSTAFHDDLLRLQKEIGIPMLVGGFARDGMRITPDAQGHIRIEQDALYNSAFVIADGHVQEGRYDKMRLTPFGEEMPYISQSKWLESKLLDFGAKGMAFDLSPGGHVTMLEAPLGPWGKQERPAGRVLRIATPICFEGTVPDLVRSLAVGRDGQRADVIINLTNDGWFKDWSGIHEQHLQTARWRAIELGTPVIRAANTGISCLIDPGGNVMRRGPDGREKAVGVDGVMTVSVPVGWARTLIVPTLYATIGDLVGWICLASAGLLIGWTYFPNIPRRPRAAPDS